MKQKGSARSRASRGVLARRSKDAASTSADTTSLRETAYEAIKHRIITCAFRPGEYINELQLSSLLKIGRTPVHQALDRLMMEGMVEVIPRKGVIVKPVILQDVMQMIDVRMINETQCARLAAARADDTDIETLRNVLDRARQAISGRDINSMMLLDREFHLQLAAASKNFELAEVLRKEFKLDVQQPSRGHSFLLN